MISTVWNLLSASMNVRIGIKFQFYNYVNCMEFIVNKHMNERIGIKLSLSNVYTYVPECTCIYKCRYSQ